MSSTIADTRAAVEQLAVRHSLPCVLVAQANGGRVETLAVGTGAADVSPAADFLFPVASVTKLATALAVLRLAAKGQLALEDPLMLHVPEAVAAVEGVTLRMLLCHTSG